MKLPLSLKGHRLCDVLRMPPGTREKFELPSRSERNQFSRLVSCYALRGGGKASTQTVAFFEDGSYVVAVTVRESARITTGKRKGRH